MTTTCTFTAEDLTKHVEEFITAMKNKFKDDPSFLEFVLITCADHIDRQCANVNRLSMVDSRVKDLTVVDNVHEWLATCAGLEDICDNGYLGRDIYDLHSDYYDWCSFTKGIEDAQIVEFVDLYKILRSLGYRVKI